MLRNLIIYTHRVEKKGVGKVGYLIFKNLQIKNVKAATGD